MNALIVTLLGLCETTRPEAAFRPSVDRANPSASSSPQSPCLAWPPPAP